MIESVESLRTSLENLGCALFTAHARAEDFIPKLVSKEKGR